LFGAERQNGAAGRVIIGRGTLGRGDDDAVAVKNMFRKRLGAADGADDAFVAARGFNVKIVKSVKTGRPPAPAAKKPSFEQA